jgi:pyruvate dehydrogenase E2 component (dihydrolipoamide acetyltransferase)
MLLALGAVKEVPMVADGQIVIRKRMSINATFDHRLIDGFHAAVMSRVLHQWFAEPDKYFGAVPAAAARPEALPAPEEAEAAAEAREAAAG